MASSSDSAASSNPRAPESFQVPRTSSGEEDVCDGLSLETSPNHHEIRAAQGFRCPLCALQRRKFYCRSCLKNGNFAHSTTMQHGTCLTEMQQKYLHTQGRLKTCSTRYEQLIKERRSGENIQFEIKQKQKQVALLKQLIESKKKHIITLQLQREELRQANADKCKMLPKYPNMVKKLEDYVLDRIEKIAELREKNSTLLQMLQTITRRSLQQLVTYIFPISEIVLKDELRQRAEAGARSVESEAVSAALADAKNTSYIRGKWIFHGSGISEMQYRIVAPSLPANGDYSAYLEWLSDNKDDVPKTTSTEIMPSRVAAFRIVGALTYTAQLTQLMSYYLNVRLPYKLAYGDFCKKLNTEQFMRKVSRLNSNIMYLAYTQQVRLRTLNENHTLENILTILNLEKSDLGCHGCNEVANAPLNKSADSLLFGVETTTESESEDENSLRLDWEAVPSLKQDLISTNLMNPTPPARDQQSLMTSAANRIGSIFGWKKFREN